MIFQDITVIKIIKIIVLSFVLDFSILLRWGSRHDFPMRWITNQGNNL